jgi:ABC-type sugar transport system substrate-binding protein
MTRSQRTVRFALAAFAWLSLAMSGSAAAPIAIVLVAPVDNEFTVELVRDCSRATAELRGTVACSAPLRSVDGVAEVDAAVAAQALGIAILPPRTTTPALIAALGRAQAQGVPVITILHDLPAPQAHLRAGFLGNSPSALGTLLARLAWQFSKTGGVFCASFQPVDATQAEWHSALVAGLAMVPPASVGSAWLEASECGPLVTDPDPVTAANNLRDVMIGNPAIKIVVALNEIPQQDIAAFRQAMSGTISSDIKAYKRGVFAVGDTEQQKELLKDSSTVQIGSRRAHYGYRIAQIFKALSEGASPSTLFDPLGYDVCRRDNVFECNGLVTAQP